MLKSQRFYSALGLSLTVLLAGCGGAGDTLIASVGSNAPGGGGGGTSPTPYIPFANLAGDQVFVNAPVSKTSAQFFTGSEVYGDISFNATTQTYTADVFGFPVESFPKAIPTAPTVRDFFVGTGPAGNSQLTYTQFAYWFNNSAGVTGEYRAVLGVKTRSDDFPRTGVATYRQTGIQGEAYQSGGANDGIYTIGNSKLDLTVDFATNIVAGSLLLVGTPKAGGADVTFGTYTGSDRTFPLYRVGVPGNYAGFWDVAFYGPQAQEYGATFSIDEMFNGVQINAAGVVAGTKN